MVDQIRFFATAARHLEGKSAGEYMAGHTSFIRREPIGVCAQVAPWNYPMMMAVWKFAPAIAAGNTVVLKPSDTTPASTTLLAEIAAEFLPPGVFNVICGDRDTGRAMVDHAVPDDGVDHRLGARRHGGRRRGGQPTSSGSTSSSAARRRSSCSTTPTSRPPPRAIAVAGYFNAGQDCTAATRVLAGPGVYGDFVDALAEAAKGTKTGMPDDEDVLYGPVNNPSQLARVSGFVDRAPDHARVLAGGARQGDTGYFYEPTVVADLRQDDEMIQDEIFGPVITVQRFSDEDEAAALGQRRGVRAGVERVDEGLRPGDADGQAARLRVRVDQHPHPARRRDAPRRVQAVRLRQGPVAVRLRGLHPHQARDGQPRQLTRSVTDPGRSGDRDPDRSGGAACVVGPRGEDRRRRGGAWPAPG